jgi:hypothetical protein
VTGLATVAASSGVATDTVTGNVAGSVNLKATVTLSSGSTTSNTLSFTVSFGTATQIVLSGSTGTLAVGTTRTFTATIEDAAGNRVTSGTDSSATVTFAKTAGTGSVTGLAAVAASGGLAADTVTGSTAGSVTIQAGGTLNGTAVSSNTLAFTVTGVSATLKGSVVDTAQGTNVSTVPSVTTTNGATEMITIYRETSDSGETVSTITGPLTGATLVSSKALDASTKRNVYVWRATGNGGTGNVVVTYSNSAGKNVDAVVDVTELSGNDTTNPVVQSPTASGTGTSATASLATPGAGDAELILFATNANTTLSVPAGFTSVDAHAGQLTGQNPPGWSTQLVFAVTAQTSASSTLGASNTWGSAALEIRHA